MQTPLEKCRPAMGCNKIGALFIPDYYVKVDYAEFTPEDKAWQAEAMPMVDLGIPCLLWEKFGVTAGNVVNVPRCEHHFVPKGHKRAATAWHAPICTAYNSISVMAQWAVDLGYEEIVLVGCDLNYTDGRDDHFMPDYYERVDSQYAERNNQNARWAHEFIRDNCPIPVYDATIDGTLTYPRMKL